MGPKCKSAKSAKCRGILRVIPGKPPGIPGKYPGSLPILNFAPDFAPDRLSDSGKLASFPRETREKQNGAPNTLWFPWKLLETQSWGPSGFPLGCRKPLDRPTYAPTRIWRAEKFKVLLRKRVGHRAQLMLRASRGDRENNHPVPLYCVHQHHTKTSPGSSLRGVTTNLREGVEDVECRALCRDVEM